MSGFWNTPSKQVKGKCNEAQYNAVLILYKCLTVCTSGFCPSYLHITGFWKRQGSTVYAKVNFQYLRICSFAACE